MVKVIYVEGELKTVVAEVLTDRSMSVEEVLDAAGVDINEWAAEQGWEAVDYGALEIEV